MDSASGSAESAALCEAAMSISGAGFDPPGFGWASTVHDFIAFKGVDAIPEVVAAHTKLLQNVGLIEVGEGEKFAWLPVVERMDHPMASLSPCGVLCIGGRIRSGVLTAVHLPSKRIATIACKEKTLHGFVHGGELFVAQLGHAVLRHAPVAEVFAGRTELVDFDLFSLAAEWGSAPRLDAAAAGWVAVANWDNRTQHMVVDLAARTSRLVDVGHRLPSLGGFTGIAAPRTGWAATRYSYPVFAVSPNGAIRELAGEMGSYPTVLPSASAPADLARAAVLDYVADFSVGGVRGQLRDPVQPSCQSLVRLHRDVFLCWDRRSRAWAAVRIVVP